MKDTFPLSMALSGFSHPKPHPLEPCQKFKISFLPSTALWVPFQIWRFQIHSGSRVCPWLNANKLVGFPHQCCSRPLAELSPIQEERLEWTSLRHGKTSAWLEEEVIVFSPVPSITHFVGWSIRWYQCLIYAFYTAPAQSHATIQPCIRPYLAVNPNKHGLENVQSCMYLYHMNSNDNLCC